MNNELAQSMEEKLYQAWSERDATIRLKVIEKLYAAGSNLYHVDHKTTGLDAINNSVTNTLRNMPEAFVFTKLKPIIINNSIGRLIWGVGPKGKPSVATGMDIAHFENGKIKSLYVFLDN